MLSGRLPLRAVRPAPTLARARPTAMFGRLPRQPIWFCVTLVGVGSAPAAGSGSPPVRVTVWEGLPKGWAWQAPAGDPAERFDWPAVGFVRLPARYNARGIEVDRAGPFAVRAEATLHEPPGTYR